MAAAARKELEAPRLNIPPGAAAYIAELITNARFSPAETKFNNLSVRATDHCIAIVLRVARFPTAGRFRNHLVFQVTTSFVSSTRKV